jgi:uncharacterized protein
MERGDITITGRIPTDEDRLNIREKPSRTPLMYQTWRRLLLLHWEWDPGDIQARLPDGLTVDTFKNHTYVGLTPFFLENLRPVFMPPIPGVSNFHELNVRTYVYDEAGRPGVWFFSLDCNQTLAVQAARAVYCLPYYKAAMDAAEAPNEITFRCTRAGLGRTASFGYQFDVSGINTAPSGSLEFFLTERYLLFSRCPRTGALYSAQVHHLPHSLCNVHLLRCDTTMLELDGFVAPARPPDHATLSLRCDVNVYAPEAL